MTTWYEFRCGVRELFSSNSIKELEDWEGSPLVSTHSTGYFDFEGNFTVGHSRARIVTLLFASSLFKDTMCSIQKIANSDQV